MFINHVKIRWWETNLVQCPSSSWLPQCQEEDQCSWSGKYSPLIGQHKLISDWLSGGWSQHGSEAARTGHQNHQSSGNYCHAAARTSHVMFRLLASMLLECLWWRVWCRLVSRWSALLTWPLSTGTGLREPRRNQERIKRVYHFRLLSTMLLSRLSLHSRVSSRGLSSSAVIFKQIKHTETDQKITVEGVMDQSSQVNTHIWLDETDEYWSLIGGYLQQQKKIGSWEYCGGAGQNQCHPFCKSPIVNQVNTTDLWLVHTIISHLWLVYTINIDLWLV